MLDIISTCANKTHLRQLYGAVVRCYNNWRRPPPRGLTDVIAKHVPLIARDSQTRHPPPATNSADFVLKKVVDGRGSLVDWVSCVPTTWCSSGPSLLLCPVIPSTTIADTSQRRHSVSHPTHCSREQGLSHVQTATSRTDAVMETHEAPLRINSASAGHAVITSCSQSPGAAQPCHPALSSDTVTMARHNSKSKDCVVSELRHIRRNPTSSSSDSSQRSLQRSSGSDRSEMNQSSASEAENCVAAVQPRDCVRSNKTYLDRNASGGCEMAGFCEDVDCGSSVHPARFCQLLDFLCASHPGNIGDGSSCKYAKTPHHRNPSVSNSFPQRLSEEDIRNVVRSFVTSNLADDVIHRIIGREFDECGS